jgi:hypothetical protein
MKIIFNNMKIIKILKIIKVKIHLKQKVCWLSKEIYKMVILLLLVNNPMKLPMQIKKLIF